MSQIAQSAGVPFSVLVVSSRRLGTQAEMLAGEGNFVLNPSAAPQTIPRSANGHLSCRCPIMKEAEGGKSLTTIAAELILRLLCHFGQGFSWLFFLASKRELTVTLERDV